MATLGELEDRMRHEQYELAVSDVLRLHRDVRDLGEIERSLRVSHPDAVRRNVSIHDGILKAHARRQEQLRSAIGRLAELE